LGAEMEIKEHYFEVTKKHNFAVIR
jgi:hypothetical protein